MRRLSLIGLSLFLCLFLIGCTSDKSNEIEKIGSDIFAYLNNGTEDMYNIDFPSIKKIDTGYEYNGVIESKMINSYSGTHQIKFDNNAHIKEILVTFENLSQENITNISYSLQAYYLQLISDNENILKIGTVDKNSINQITTSLSNISMYGTRLDNVVLKTGNYTSKLNYDWSTAFTNGILELSIVK